MWFAFYSKTFLCEKWKKGCRRLEAEGFLLFISGICVDSYFSSCGFFREKDSFINSEEFSTARAVLSKLQLEKLKLRLQQTLIYSIYVPTHKAFQSNGCLIDAIFVNVEIFRRFWTHFHELDKYIGIWNIC